ncbi:hypothetical protein ACFX13_012374 [Malus domestica]
MSDPLVALGHPLIELMVGFYTQKVTSKTKWLASLAFKGAQRVTVLPIFARSIEDSEAEEQAKVPDCYRPVFDRIQRRYSSASTYDVPKDSKAEEQPRVQDSPSCG